MLTDLFEGIDALLEVPGILRYLVWLQVSQTVLLALVVALLAARRQQTDDKKEAKK